MRGGVWLNEIKARENLFVLNRENRREFISERKKEAVEDGQSPDSCFMVTSGQH